MGGQGIDMLVPTLLELGTEEQKKQYIKPTFMEKLFGVKDTLNQMLEAILASLQTKGELINDSIGLLMVKKFGPVLLSIHK